MKKALHDLDVWLDGKLPLVALLALVVVLRLPGFFEPYWYGDEGIYLTVGQSINAGQTLYSQIVDHKTPIIYYLARVPGQFEFRVLLLAWMLFSTSAFFMLAKKILHHFWPVMVSSVLFVLLTTLPWLEGHIPNGELFVMGFVLAGGWILTRSELWQLLMDDLPQPKDTFPLRFWVKNLPQQIFALFKSKFLFKWQINQTESLKLVAAGVFFSLAILTKVPALFDVLAWFVLGWLLLTRTIKIHNSEVELNKKLVIVVQQWLLLFLGIVLPIVASMLYFSYLGAGGDYLNFGLLYNFHYAGNWGLPFSNPILIKFFTLPGKFLVAAVIILMISFWRNKYTSKYQFIAIWLMLSLFGSLLSNRPYPHYFQQIVVPLTLLIGMLTHWLIRIKTDVKNWQKYFWSLGTTIDILLITLAAFVLIGFRPYESTKYYSDWLKLITHRISAVEYRNQFNYLMDDNYQAAQFLQDANVKRLFIWGTNPMLYALSKTIPIGRFTVSFHIVDIGAYDETMAALESNPPPYIIVMNDENTPFPEFFSFLYQNYIPGNDYQHFTLWKYVKNSSLK